jgi:hypothetical protein
VKVQSNIDRFLEARIRVIGIGFSSRESLTSLRSELGLSFELISDPTKAWYKAFQPHRAGLRSLLSPRVWVLGIRALVSRRSLVASHEDVWQLGADVLLEDNTVVRVWSSRQLERRPEIDEIILAAVNHSRAIR